LVDHANVMTNDLRVSGQDDARVCREMLEEGLTINRRLSLVIFQPSE
jgi:hypothetical protein